MMRTNRRIAVTLAAVVLAGATGAGVVQASPGTGSRVAPSACRPANHLAKITQDNSSAGHLHYRVTLTAPRGYASCELAGSPTGVRFSNHGSARAISAGHYGGQRSVVRFGPNRPVHFDIQVPNVHTGPANEVSFTLRTPGGGHIPGTSFADGRFTVSKGTSIGPIRPGA